MTDLGQAFIDRIEALLQPCHSASEWVRDACLSDEAPDEGLAWEAVVELYQDQLVSRWHEDYPSLKHAVIDWNAAWPATAPADIRALQADVHHWPGTMYAYLRVCDGVVRWDWSEAWVYERATAAQNLHMYLEDQLGLWDAWLSSYRRRYGRTGA